MHPMEGPVMAIAHRASSDAKSVLAKIGNGRSVRNYQKDEIVFSQGDLADALFYLQKGKVRVTVVSHLGREVIVASLGAKEFFGEGCLTEQERRVASVAALKECTIIRIEKSAVICLIHEESRFSKMFINHLLRRSVRVEADLVDQLLNSTEKRLARLLLVSAHFGKQENVKAEIVKVSQVRLAEMVGTTRSRVSYLMDKFKKQGFIDYKGGIEVHNTLLNVVLFDDPRT
jgi:CRP/FNR family cyclic AMP-dependent transcriptional regulator